MDSNTQKADELTSSGKFLAYVMVSLDVAHSLGADPPDMFAWVEAENDLTLKLYMEPQGAAGFECRSRNAFAKALQYFGYRAGKVKP